MERMKITRHPIKQRRMLQKLQVLQILLMLQNHKY